MDKPKLWTKDFIIVTTVNFFITLVFYLLIVIMGIYVVEHYNASTSQAGLVTGICIVGALIGRIFIGSQIEKIGRKKTLYIGLALYTITTAMYFIQIDINFLLVIRLLQGIVLGVASTATGTIVAQIIPRTRKGEGIGYYSMSSPLATAIGPFIGFLMIQHASFNMIFALCVVVTIISLVTAFFLYVPKLEDFSTTEKELKRFSVSNFIEIKAIPIAIITLVVAFCYSSILSYINFYAIEIDQVATASFFFLVYSLAVLLSRPFTGRLLDMKGANYVMYPAFILFTIGLFLLSIGNNAIALLTAGALIGLGFGNLQSCTQAIAVKITPPHRMGLATSTFFIFLDAGLGFGPYLLGFFITFMTYGNLYGLLSGVVLLSSILYFFLYGKKEKQLANE
ncbi:MFS transporter [Ureibacillus manganicus]|uniref:Multidrug MFS transporter n=1 Tax=Ureibacillus manganicus DSM 26584 TaxID=1384049 RepID=A0A0A3I3H1_9BACL|nr:MFS transporter [Ureibacillus manganicus]KGR78055.1 multidrug MFS transporter [Ureibacillus manganicus DSM 26584]